MSSELLIGSYGSLSGQYSYGGKELYRGISLAVAEVNRDGGINGARVDYQFIDDRSDVRKSELAMSRLIEIDMATAILGGTTSKRALAVASMCQNRGIPFVNTGASSEVIPQVGDYVFLTNFGNRSQAIALAKFAYASLECRRIGILYNPDDVYSQDMKVRFAHIYTHLGGEIAFEIPCLPGASNTRDILKAIQTQKIDGLFSPFIHPQGPTEYTAIRKSGMTIPIISGDGWLFEDSPPITNLYHVKAFWPENPDKVTQGFVKAYFHRYHEPPDDLSALGYDAARILFRSIREAKSLSGHKIRDALQNTAGFPGVCGKTTIDKQRHAEKDVYIFSSNKEKQVKVKTISAQEIRHLSKALSLTGQKKSDPPGPSEGASP